MGGNNIQAINEIHPDARNISLTFGFGGDQGVGVGVLGTFVAPVVVVVAVVVFVVVAVVVVIPRSSSNTSTVGICESSASSVPLFTWSDPSSMSASVNMSRRIFFKLT